MDGSEPEADYGPNPDSEEEQAELEEQPGYSNAGVSTPSDAGTMPQRSEGVSFTSFDRWRIVYRRSTLDCTTVDVWCSWASRHQHGYTNAHEQKLIGAGCKWYVRPLKRLNIN